MLVWLATRSPETRGPPGGKYGDLRDSATWMKGQVQTHVTLVREHTQTHTHNCNLDERTSTDTCYIGEGTHRHTGATWKKEEVTYTEERRGNILKLHSYTRVTFVR